MIRKSRLKPLINIIKTSQIMLNRLKLKLNKSLKNMSMMGGMLNKWLNFNTKSFEEFNMTVMICSTMNDDFTITLNISVDTSL